MLTDSNAIWERKEKVSISVNAENISHKPSLAYPELVSCFRLLWRHNNLQPSISQFDLRGDGNFTFYVSDKGYQEHSSSRQIVKNEFRFNTNVGQAVAINTTVYAIILAKMLILIWVNLLKKLWFRFLCSFFCLRKSVKQNVHSFSKILKLMLKLIHNIVPKKGLVNIGFSLLNEYEMGLWKTLNVSFKAFSNLFLNCFA